MPLCVSLVGRVARLEGRLEGYGLLFIRLLTLPLALPAAKSGPLVESGFQAILASLLVRLAVDHPHHTLYQVFALKNGNRGRDGKPEAGGVGGGMSYTVDLDKVGVQGIPGNLWGSLWGCEVWQFLWGRGPAAS
jgi:hypothetical protein